MPTATLFPFALALLCVAGFPGGAQTVPKTWDVAAMESGILKPPVARATVTRVTADYYYRMREREEACTENSRSGGGEEARGGRHEARERGGPGGGEQPAHGAAALEPLEQND